MEKKNQEVLKVAVDDDRDAAILEAGFIPGWIGEGGLRPEPSQDFLPSCWRWQEGRKLLLLAAQYIDPEKSERRNIRLANPAEGKRTSLNNIHCSYQMVAPNEFARPHRHTVNAGRLILESHYAYTTLDGEKVYMKPNDIVLTPNWVWHGLGNESDVDPAFWIDFLDDPLVNSLQAMFFEVENQIEFDLVEQTASPFHIKWSDLQEKLEYCMPDEYGRFGSRLPIENGSIPTMNLYIDRLDAGMVLKKKKSTANRMFICIEGEGITVVEGEEFFWTRGDVVAVPSWKEFFHSTKTGGILFECTDEPVLHLLNWYREEI
ncbi:MAG: cupin domain-containing protein [Pseudomonadota bacterium]|nr:cupin domain-containing protein [Pseudomonadota bacterium]